MQDSIERSNQQNGVGDARSEIGSFAYAMRAAELRYASGAAIGKALAVLPSGCAFLLIVIALR